MNTLFDYKYRNTKIQMVLKAFWESGENKRVVSHEATDSLYQAYWAAVKVHNVPVKVCRNRTLMYIIRIGGTQW